MSKKLFLQSSIYSFGKIFTLIAGLISYPILTKNLSISEYGTVALITVTIGLLTSFMKFGLQHSVIRFYHDLDNSIFITNIVDIAKRTLLKSSLLILTTGVILSYISDVTIFKIEYIFILTISAISQSIQSYIGNLYIAKEKSKTVTIFSIIYRILSLITMLIAILLIEASAYSFAISLVIADVIYITGLLIWVKNEGFFKNIKKIHIDNNITQSMMLFGIPMLGYEMSNMIHAFVDRFMIEYFMGAESLGLYSASYNMANIVSNIIMGGIVTAIVPYYLKTWKLKGREETEKLLTKVNNVFMIIIPAVIAGLYSISEPLMGFLATEEYISVAYIVPVAALGILINRSSIIYAAGLQIKKSTKKLFQFVVESTIINIVLNYIFIPKYGLPAAAVITVLSYLWMAFRFYFEGNKTLSVRFNYFLLCRSVAYSLIMIYILEYVIFESYGILLLTRIISGVLIYISLLYVFETRYRKIALEEINKWIKARHTS